MNAVDVSHRLLKNIYAEVDHAQTKAYSVETNVRCIPIACIHVEILKA